MSNQDKPAVSVNDLSHLVRLDVKFSSIPTGAEKAETFYAEIEFSSVQDAAECGQRFVVWLLQQKARKGLIKPGKENAIKVDSKGIAKRSAKDTVAAMNAKQVAEMMELLKAKMEALALQELEESELEESTDEFAE